MATKLTKAVVDALKPTTTNVFVWDQDVHGFCVKVNRGGSKTYCLQYKRGRRTRRYTIGGHGSPWTVDTARTEAKRILGLVAQGQDPAAQKVASREGPTVKDVSERFLREHVEAKRKGTTAREYQRQLKRIILPRIGAIAIADVTPSDVQRLHHRLASTPYQANRVAAVMSKMFNLAERWGLRPSHSNPCRVERFTERARRRYLDATELGRLGTALVDLQDALDPFAIAGIKLLVFTGARLSEVLRLTWDQVDADRQVLRLGDSKTGPKDVQLNAPAIAVLRRLPRVEGNPHVLPGRKRTPRRDLKGPWNVIRTAARLDCRIHDLRHCFASVGVNQGLSLSLIGGLLGHRSQATTQRYAHLQSDPLKVAAAQIGDHLVAALSGEARR